MWSVTSSRYFERVTWIKKRVFDEALRLPPEARAALAAELIATLDEEADPDAEALWSEEIRKRLDEVDSGAVRPIPWAEARRRTSPPPAVTRPLDVHPSAQAEAEAAARYYAERSPRAADAFVDELDDAIAQIELAPHAFLQHVHGTRRLLLRTFPFAVVYRFDDDTILIVAVAHGSRRPGYWAYRLPAGAPG